MRKLPAAAQEERRRQVVGLRQRGLTYRAIAGQVGLSRTGVIDICQRFAAEGAKGLVSKPRGRKPDEQRLLDAAQEAEIQGLIRRHTPDELGLPFALWSRAAVGLLITRRCGVELAVRTVGKYLARWGFTAQKPIRRAYEQALRCPSTRFARGTFGSSARRRCGAGCDGTIRRLPHGPSGHAARSSGAMRPGCARTTCAAAATPRVAGHRWFGSATSAPG
jgi:transposase